VTITYAVLLGSLGLGMALAFGLGGRDTAARLVSGAYDKGQEQQDQVKRDMQLGKERSQRQAERAKQKVQEKVETENAPAPHTPPPGTNR
jgi:hypothetical protein